MAKNKPAKQLPQGKAHIEQISFHCNKSDWDLWSKSLARVVIQECSY